MVNDIDGHPEMRIINMANQSNILRQLLTILIKYYTDGECELHMVYFGVFFIIVNLNSQTLTSENKLNLNMMVNSN